MTDLAHLERICEAGLRAVGYELVDLEYLREPHGWVLRLFIDRPWSDADLITVVAEDHDRVAPDSESDADAEPDSEKESKAKAVVKLPAARITHKDCEVASKHLGTVLDVEDPIDTKYHLEVSSPGVRRRVRKERDFVRFRGHPVRIQLEEMIDGRKNYLGTIITAADGCVAVDVDGARFELPIRSIRKACLEVDL